MRKYYVDNIRWMVGILVVIYHVIYMYNGVTTAGVIGPFHQIQYQDGLLYVLYPWFMVILFIVSGISSGLYLNQYSNKEFIKNRTRKLLVPSTLGLFAFQWILGYFSMEISHAFETIPDVVPKQVLYLIMALSGTGVLWYMQLLWIFSLGLVLICKIERGKLFKIGARANPVVLLGLGIFVWLFAQVLNTPVIVVYRFGIYGFCYLLGYFIFGHEEVMERLSRYWHVFCVTALVLGCGYVWYYFGDNYAIEPVVNSPFSVAYGWITILAVFGTMKKWGDRTNGLFGWMTRKSFGLYVFHYLPLSMMALFLNRCTNFTALPSYLLTGVASFAGGYLLYEIISRIPLFRYCVLGILDDRRIKESKVINGQKK